MLVLVINAGSSSLKLDLLDPATGARRFRARAERIGGQECRWSANDSPPEALPGASHDAALRTMLEALGDDRPDAVAHRVVHGGAEFAAPCPIDDAVVAKIQSLSSLAPLHNPANLAAIRTARGTLAELPHVAVFDTAFHSTLPARAQRYALPTELCERQGIRRYGFHGPSHAWVTRRAARAVGQDPCDLRIVSCHLGNGASLAAVEYGRSVETSMGMTPLEGLVMGTRAGDVDAGALLHLARSEAMDLDALDELLNKRSGLAGLSGIGNDMRDIEERAADGDERCRAAIQVFCHRIRKYIGAYAAVMGGLDLIVFTGGIGENSALVRHRALQRLDFLGARLDEDRNRDARVSLDQPCAVISDDRSRTPIVVAKTDEAWSMAKDAAAIVARDRIDHERKIPIAISARHIHLTQEAVEALFGPGHQLTPRADLSQPGQFACEETLTVVGPKRRLEGVRVLGPTRSKCQIEISRTDEFFLGVDAPVRNSGDVDQSPGVTLVGSSGSLTLKQGLICARRHIHMTPADAEAFGVSDRDVVEVAVDSAGRDLVFGDVLVRVKPTYALEMHIDTDEANAAELSRGAEGLLQPTEGSARILSRRVSLGSDA